MTIDPTKLKRDPKKISSYLKTDNKSIITKEELYIIFPELYLDKEINVLGDISLIVGIFAILDPTNNLYSVSTIPTRVEVTPSEISYTIINGDSYVLLKIDKNDIFINNLNLVKDKSLAYLLFDTFFVQGKIPFYVTYLDLPNIFNNLYHYTGSKAGQNRLIYELLTAIITKYRDNPDIGYRNILDSLKDLDTKPVIFKGLKDIHYTVTSSLSKITGSYYKQGILSAINKPDSNVSNLENIVRE